MKIKIEDIIKQSQVEVLLSFIDIQKEKTNVSPVKCPAVGRKDDYLKDANKNPACMLSGKICNYFEAAQFILEDYTKKIMCNAVNLEDVKKSKE